jgi:ABC-type sugar transport system substrate-binding protein
MVEQLQPLTGWVEAGGGAIDILSCEFDPARQMGMYEDAITRAPDAIISKPINAPTLVTYIEQAKAAGIPFVNSLLPILGPDKKLHPDILTYVGDYNDDRGLVTGMYLAWWAEQNQTPITVLEQWGIYSFEEWSVPVDRGFREGLGGSEWVTVIDSDEAQFNNDLAYTVTLDSMTAHPDINAIYVTTCMQLNGTISALQSLGRWELIGDPNHMMLLTGDAEPWMIDLGLDGYIDFDMDYGCYQYSDLVTKSLYWAIVRGQDIPKHVFTVSKAVVQEPTGIYGERGEWTYQEMHDFNESLGTDYANWAPFQGYIWSDQLALPNADTPSWDTGVPERPSWTYQD